MFGAILQYRRVWRQTLRFGAKPYELVFAWRYTLRTHIHLALYCNTVGFAVALAPDSVQTLPNITFDTVSGLIDGGRIRKG